MFFAFETSERLKQLKYYFFSSVKVKCLFSCNTMLEMGAENSHWRCHLNQNWLRWWIITRGFIWSSLDMKILVSLLLCISYEKFQHCKLVLNAVGLYREFLAPHTSVFVWAVGNVSQQAVGWVHHWHSSLEQSRGCLWSTGTPSFCHTPCPGEGDQLQGLAVRPQLLHLGNAGGREEAGAQGLLASKLTICRHCWNRWLFCTHYGTFSSLSYMIYSQVSFPFSAVEKWFCS